MADLQALRLMLSRIESLADCGPDWARRHLADLLEDFRPRLSTAALHADKEGFAVALYGLHAMVKRYLITTSL